MLISKQLPLGLVQIEEEKKEVSANYDKVDGADDEAGSQVYTARNASHEEEGVDDSSEDE